MKGFDFMKIFTDQFGLIIKFFDNAYKQGWLLYLIGGMIIFVIFVIFFN